MWNQITEEVLAKETDETVQNVINKYNNLRQEVLSLPRENLIKDKKSVIDFLIKRTEPLIDPTSQPEKAFAQKMSNDQSQENINEK